RVEHVSGEIESVAFGPETEFVENKWGIREPVDGQSANHGDIDMVLLPLLCFDRRGHRVGYGKGFYDRFLGKCRPDCVKIGLSYFPPEAEIDDVNELDVKLDRCITPERAFDFGTHKDAAKH
ncbi:MAG: 5-formyltetrahydrofolate cyclo-ligase, partial [Acidobacteriota bacterium]